MNYQKQVICGFPGVGKTTFKNQTKNLIVQDSDSSNFPKDQFPQNYIQHIQAALANEDIDYILVSSHDNVRAALAEAEIPYVLVYPNKECKSEYLERYRNRGSSEAFIKLLSDNWDSWVAGCSNDIHAIKKIGLTPGQTLSDIVV